MAYGSALVKARKVKYKRWLGIQLKGNTQRSSPLNNGGAKKLQRHAVLHHGLTTETVRLYIWPMCNSRESFHTHTHTRLTETETNMNAEKIVEAVGMMNHPNEKAIEGKAVVCRSKRRGEEGKKEKRDENEFHCL